MLIRCGCRFGSFSPRDKKVRDEIDDLIKAEIKTLSRRLKSYARGANRDLL